MFGEDGEGMVVSGPPAEEVYICMYIYIYVCVLNGMVVSGPPAEEVYICMYIYIYVCVLNGMVVSGPPVEEVPYVHVYTYIFAGMHVDVQYIM